MVPSSFRAIRWILPTAVLVPIVLAAVLLAPTGGPGTDAARPPAAAPRLADAGPAPALSVSPGTWTTEEGGSLDLSASVVDVPEFCGFASAQTTWSLPGIGGDFAYLNRTDGLAVSAQVYSGVHGFFTVEAELFGTLACGLQDYPTDLTANTTVTVLPPVSVGGISAGPDPAPPGSLGRVGWTISGGVPPYAISVDFGDNSSGGETQSTPGNGSLFHRFGAGVYAPTVRVTDAIGSSSQRQDPAPLIIEDGLSVAVASSQVEAEVDRPLWFNASVIGGVGPYDLTWYENGAPIPSLPDLPDAAEVVPASSGPLAVGAAVTDAAGNQGVGSDRFHVAAAPAVSLAPVRTDGEVGRPYALDVDLTGGYGPYDLRWQLGANATPESLNLTANGSREIEFVPGSVGPFEAEIAVSDALGGSASAAVPIGPFGLPPFVSAGVDAGVGEVGLPIDLSLSVVGGIGPYNWTVEPSIALGNASPLSGSFGAGSTFDWAGTPISSGNLTLRTFLLDADGGLAEANASVSVLGAPSLQITTGAAGPVASAAYPVHLLIAGGEAPYEIVAQLGDGPKVSANLSFAGPLDLSVETAGSGFSELSIDLRDALGGARNASEYVDVGAPGSAPLPAPGQPPVRSADPPSTASFDLIGLAVAAAVGVPLAFLAGRARRSDPRAVPAAEGGRALQVVRRLLVDGEPYDPETLALLAEEEGVPPDAVDAALARWERSGRVRRDPDDGAGTMVRWVPIGPSGGDLGAGRSEGE